MIKKKLYLLAQTVQKYEEITKRDNNNNLLVIINCNEQIFHILIMYA